MVRDSGVNNLFGTTEIVVPRFFNFSFPDSGRDCKCDIIFFGVFCDIQRVFSSSSESEKFVEEILESTGVDIFLPFITTF